MTIFLQPVVIIIHFIIIFGPGCGFSKSTDNALGICLHKIGHSLTTAFLVS